MRTAHPTRPAPSTPVGQPLLEVRDVRVRYGGIEALRGVSLEIRRGEVVALIGANGAGKTTTLRAIARLLEPSEGVVRFDGGNLLSLGTEDAVQRGVSLVPEGRGVFPNLTVHENLDLGAWNHRHRATMAETIDDVVQLFPRLGERMKQEAGTLSGGEQQMLAIGRALMARPSLLLLDEPSLGIAPKLVHQIFEAVGKVAASGTTILVVEQNTRVALAASQRAYVMRTGEIVRQGASRQLADDPEIQAAYLGG